MKKNSKNTKNNINEFLDIFAAAPSKEEKKWGILNDFYHMVLTYMEKNRISRKTLADNLGVSKSRISQLLNDNPNISVSKMVDIAEAVGINLKISSDKVDIFNDEYEQKQPQVLVKNIFFITDQFQKIHIKEENSTNLDAVYNTNCYPKGMSSNNQKFWA